MINKIKLASAKKWTIAIIVALPILYIASAIVSTIVNPASKDPYCRSIDPTGCEVTVNIYNDSSETYVVKQCSGDFRTPACDAYANTATLQPGQSQKAIGSTEKDPSQPWIVFNAHNKVIGCVNLVFTKDAQSPTTVPLSKLNSCAPYL